MRSLRLFRLVLCLFLVLVSLAVTAEAQTVERVLTNVEGKYALTGPVQIALAPSGTEFAVSDELSNRVFVFDTEGQLLWVVGDEVRLDQPSAVCFEANDVLLFSLRKQPRIFRTTARATQTVDTVADLSTVLKSVESVDRLVKSPNGPWLVLDADRAQLDSFSNDWKTGAVLVNHAQDKGKLWSPSAVALDLAGNIIVSDEGRYPVQMFSPAGVFVITFGWANPVGEQPFEAGAVAVNAQEIVWVADLTNGQWRLFDAAGNEIEQRPFLAVSHPTDAVFTADNKLVVVDKPGAVVIYSEP